MSAVALVGLSTSLAAPRPALAAVPAAGLASHGPVLEPAPPSSFTGHLRAWTGTASDVPGAPTYSDGELILTDHPFDDHGGDTNVHDADPSEQVVGPGQGANAAGGYAPGVTGGANGDYKYPAGPAYAHNAADIVETRLAADPSAWYLLVRFNTMIDPELTAVEARIGTSRLIMHGRTARFDGHPVQAAADAEHASFEVRIPRSLYEPGRGRHGVFVAAGLWDVHAGGWLVPAAGKPPYFDLAYVPSEGMDSYWRDRQQSLDIVNDSFANDYVEVDFGALASHSCPGPCYSGPTRGLFTRSFRSGQPLGRGVTLQTRYAQDSSPDSPPNVYLSPTQPYAIYVPAHPTGAMVLLLHFLAGNHMSYSLTSMPALSDWAEKLGAIVVMPLARGEGGWYEGEAEKDVFEAWRDVAAHYTVDPDRVYLAGMSMGGYGTWRLGELYPDLFARGLVWAGPAISNGVWAYPAPAPQPSCAPDQPPTCGHSIIDLFGNTLDLPLFVTHGAIDELVPSTGAEHWMADYASSVHATYRYLLLASHHHETNFPASTEQWLLTWLRDLPARDRDPVHVTYTLRREYAQPRFHLAYDGAYWTRGMTLAPGSDAGTVDANRGGAGGRVEQLADQYGVDALGAYRLRGANAISSSAAENFVDLRMSGLGALTLDTARMAWNNSRTEHLVGRTDHQVALALAGDYAPGTTVKGAAARLTSGGLELIVAAGPIDIVVSPPLTALVALPNTAGGASPGSTAVVITMLFAAIACAHPRRRRASKLERGGAPARYVTGGS